MTRSTAFLASVLAIASGCDPNSAYCTDNPWPVGCPAPGGPAATSSGGTGGDVPCGADPCSDGADGTLQDVGETCSGDDEAPGMNGGGQCCHGLACLAGSLECAATQGSTPCACVRPSTAPAGSACPSSLWLYQCDGTFVPRTAMMTPVVWIGRFTGPPPSAVSAQGGLTAWMKIAFAAKYPTVVLATPAGPVTYFFLNAKNCVAIGPFVPVP